MNRRTNVLKNIYTFYFMYAILFSNLHTLLFEDALDDLAAICREQGGIMPQYKEDYVKTEKVNGIVYDMSPSGGFRHSQINSNLHHILRQQLKNSICAVSMENLDLYLSDDEYVIPDIMLICDRNQVKNDKYRGVPRFVAETLSPATSLKDKTIKKDIYAKLGIDEYWILSPGEKSVEVYYLEDTSYRMVGSYILVNDEQDENFNADKILTLKAMPAVSIVLKEIFENIE